MTAARDWRHISAGLALGGALFWAMPSLPQTAGHQPDAKRGGLIAEQGTPAGAAACAQCHGETGAADESGTFPRVAGQSTRYLAEQLRDFAADLRPDDIMTPIAKAMTPDEMADVAAFYAGIAAPFPQLPAPDGKLLIRGKQLATVGDAAKNVQACNSCHGPGGIGEPPTVPYLAGQFSQYIGQTLQAWQQGLRKNGANVMAPIAKQLDDDDIAAVAAFYQQVRAPSSAATK